MRGPWGLRARCFTRLISSSYSCWNFAYVAAAFFAAAAAESAAFVSFRETRQARAFEPPIRPSGSGTVASTPFKISAPMATSNESVTMTARSEGFRSLPIKARRARTAVGLTRDNRLQFVAVRQGITLWELAKIMRALGAYHAVALDGGTSTALYFGGRFIARPGRALTNVLMIYHRRDRYEAMRGEFAS